MYKTLKSLLSCFVLGCFINACNGQTAAVLTATQNDDAVAKFFGDSVASIIAAPTKVNVFTLKKAEANTAAPKKKAKFINGYPVDKEIKNISTAKYSVLQFLMQDSINYQRDSLAARKCFFNPYLAVEFVKGKETATVVIAFNCECWGVFFKEKLLQSPYLCHRQLLRLAKGILPDDAYIKELLTFSTK